METLDKARALSWFDAHKGHWIEITCRGSMLRLRGRNSGVLSLDACGANYEECALEGVHEDIHIGCLFHDQSLGIHVSVSAPNSESIMAALPLNIPYEDLMLTTKADASEEQNTGEKAQEPGFSPYELLH